MPFEMLTVKLQVGSRVPLCVTKTRFNVAMPDCILGPTMIQFDSGEAPGRGGGLDLAYHHRSGHA
jgi:hypothetical protein